VSLYAAWLGRADGRPDPIRRGFIVSSPFEYYMSLMVNDGRNMTEFIVRRFSDFGVPEIKLCKVEARNEHEAAEKACGVALTAKQRPAMYLRADVRTVQRMNDHHHFYEVD
jgi:hypothetical protein